MKRFFSIVLCILMLLSVLPVGTLAADDAVGLHYTLSLQEVTPPAAGSSYAVDGEFQIKVILESDGSAKAPLYATQFTLSYDPVVLSPEKITLGLPSGAEKSEDKVAGTITVAYVDSTLAGRTLDDTVTAATITFKTLRDGKSELALSNFIVTNSDGSKRSAEADSDMEVTVGTGELVIDKPALQSLYNQAKSLYDSTLILGDDETANYNTWFIRAADAVELETALADTLTLLNKQDAGKYEIKTALYILQGAKENFSSLRQYLTESTGGGDRLITVRVTCGEHGHIKDGYESMLLYYGTSVTVISVPDEGYETGKIIVNGKTYTGTETFTLQKLTNDTKIEVFFRTKLPFTDIERGAWYDDGVHYCVEKGIMNGVSSDKFNPSATLSRAMIVTMLYRMESSPANSGSMSFSDVAAGQWYTEAICWAQNTGIVTGYSDTAFGPNDNVTREQLAAILWRYAKYKGYDVSVGQSTDISGYDDATGVGDWAVSALRWAVGAGIINGIDNSLEAGSTATRAQAACMIQRFCESAAG